MLPKLRVEINKFKALSFKDTSAINFDNYKPFNPPENEQPKFKEGDIVHYKLEIPYSALNKPQNTKNFRQGDLRFSKEARKIVKVIYMSDEPFYRYMLMN